jgi:glycosyltransferase involved in cell wall biosynthesis
MNDVTFSVIVPTAGRRSLRTTLASVAEQLEPGDEALVGCSDDDEFGHRTRQALMERARATHLVFIDDDDQLARGALATMRTFARQHPGTIGIFRMRRRDGRVLWSEPVLRLRNVGTPMFCVPNVPGKLGRWESPDYPRVADWEFIRSTVELQGEPVFRDEVVAHIRADRRAAVRAVQRLVPPLADVRYRLAPRTRVRRLLRRRV